MAIAAMTFIVGLYMSMRRLERFVQRDCQDRRLVYSQHILLETRPYTGTNIQAPLNVGLERCSAERQHPRTKGSGVVVRAYLC